MFNEKECKKLKEKLLNTKKHVWFTASTKEKKNISLYKDDYKLFLDDSKTERESVDTIIKIAKKHDFVLSNSAKPKTKKLIWSCRGCAAAVAVVGKKSIEHGVKIIGSHIDSPRIDLKRNPLFEDENMAFLKSKFYGGIKKYQWLTIPLAIHGIITLQDGSTLTLVIGEDEDDPIFVINDLLPHLGYENQLSKTMSKGVPAEKMNVLVGGFPLDADKEVTNGVKLAIMKILNDKYGLVEEDFTTAELELVPAGKARDVGFDRAFVGAYGQDDRSCAYASLKTIIEMKTPEYTSIALFIDKEEIGSDGDTGAKSTFLELVMYDLMRNENLDYKADTLTRIFSKSISLSADVTAAVDPNWTEVHEVTNNAHMGFGVNITKDGGGAGKYCANEASIELASKIRTILTANNVKYQCNDLGKLEIGGGGTICKYIAQRGIDSIDIGTPVLNMHAPLEICHVVDLYMTYKAFDAFYKSKII